MEKEQDLKNSNYNNTRHKNGELQKPKRRNRTIEKGKGKEPKANDFKKAVKDRRIVHIWLAFFHPNVYLAETYCIALLRLLTYQEQNRLKSSRSNQK